MTTDQQHDLRFAMMNGHLKLTVTETTPGGVTQTTSVTSHPWTLRILDNRYWYFAIADRPGVHPGKVFTGKESGYQASGEFPALPEGGAITEEQARAIIEQHLRCYQEQFAERLVQSEEQTLSDDERGTNEVSLRPNTGTARAPITHNNL